MKLARTKPKRASTASHCESSMSVLRPGTCLMKCVLATQAVMTAARQQVLAAPLPGLATELRVAAGDAVQAGQVLTVLRSPQVLELQCDEALYREALIALSRLDATRTQARQTALQPDERRRALVASGICSCRAT